MAALAGWWHNMTAPRRLLAGAALAAAVGIIYYYQRLAPRLRAAQAAIMAAGDLLAARNEVAQAEQSLAELRRQNRQRLGQAAAGGQGEALAVLAQIDQAIASSGMVILSRDGCRAAQAAAAPPPHLRPALAAPESPAAMAGEAKNELPADIACVSYHHMAIGNFTAALRLLRALSALAAPCRFENLALTSRDPADRRGSVTLEFDVRIYFCR